MEKILITGATGDVGRVLVKELIENKYNILCLVRRKTESEKEVYGNLNDYFSLLNATKDIDIVIHLAAATEGKKEILNKVNVEGTKNLIKACEENKVKKIIFVSSLDVKFDTAYGISKLKAEEIVKQSGLKYIILRPGTIYGEEFKKGISSLIRILKKTFITPVFGSGKNLYQPLYVRDLVSVINQIIDKNKFINKVYFLAGKKEINMNQLIDLTALNLRKKITKIHLPRFVGGIFVKTENFDKVCDNKEIKKDFDFNPLSIEEGIKKII